MSDDTDAIPTPEDTPVPGPGTWRWSPAAAAWVPNTPQSAADEQAEGAPE